MRQTNDPCYLCNERKEGCHSACEKYKEWKVNKQKENAIIKNERAIDAIIRGHIAETLERNKKHNHR